MLSWGPPLKSVTSSKWPSAAKRSLPERLCCLHFIISRNSNRLPGDCKISSPDPHTFEKVSRYSSRFYRMLLQKYAALFLVGVSDIFNFLLLGGGEGSPWRQERAEVGCPLKFPGRGRGVLPREGGGRGAGRVSAGNFAAHTSPICVTISLPGSRRLKRINRGKRKIPLTILHVCCCMFVLKLLRVN